MIDPHEGRDIVFLSVRHAVAADMEKHDISSG
jgi:hypothetical protein